MSSCPEAQTRQSFGEPRKILLFPVTVSSNAREAETWGSLLALPHCPRTLAIVDISLTSNRVNETPLTRVNTLTSGDLYRYVVAVSAFVNN